MSNTTRLSMADWTDAALAAMASEGTTGVNIEQLARSLGTTKGSFYHHFANRQALLKAALERFDEIVTEDLEEIAAVTNPRERLMEGSLAGIDTDLDGFVDLALATDTTDPVVAKALERITKKRLDWLTETITETGVPADDARLRAEAGLATYLGLFHLQRVQGKRFTAAHLRTQIMQAVETMLG